MSATDKVRQMLSDPTYQAHHRQEGARRRSQQARSWARMRQRGHDSEQNYWLGHLDRENAELRKHLAALVHVLLAKGVCSCEELCSTMDLLDSVDSDELYLGPITPPHCRCETQSAAE